MGFEKIARFGKTETLAKWMDACGAKFVPEMKAQKLTNIKGLQYKPRLESDAFIRKVETWYTPESNVLPYAKEGKTMVKGHHNFHAYNGIVNETLEHQLARLKGGRRTPERIISDYNYDTNELLRSNLEFTKLMPQPRTCTAYRGTSRYIGEARQDFDVINSANIGDIITPTRGYAYAAHQKIGAHQYMGSPYDYLGNIKFEPMLIEYRIPQGAQVSSNMEHGGEVVFAAMSKFKLISKETRLIEKLNPGGTAIGSYPYKHVVLEYIPEISILS